MIDQEVSRRGAKGTERERKKLGLRGGKKAGLLRKRTAGIGGAAKGGQRVLVLGSIAVRVRVRELGLSFPTFAEHASRHGSGTR